MRLMDPEVNAQKLADDGSKRLLFGFAAVLFLAGFVVAVIAVLYRPQRLVLVGTDPRETAWLSGAVAKWAEQNHANLKFVPYRSPAEFDSLLAADTKHAILLAEVPFDRLALLAAKDQVLPLGKLKGVGDPAEALEPFADAATGPASIAGRAYFFPSRLSTLCLAYSNARVADAVAHASEVRSMVEGWLRDGLPQNYQLEPDPADWDSYDLLMVGAYWANQPFIDGTRARVAHATSPGALGFDLAARAYSYGAQTDEVLALDGFGVRDALAWESLWLEHGLYDSSMVAERWTPEDVARQVAKGRIWMATLDPSVILRLHGLKADSASAFEQVHAADIGLARMPRGVSLELRNKYPERTGDPWSARGGYWWGVPKTSPDPRLAVHLVHAMTTAEFQAEAIRMLGWMPTRKDLVDGLGNVLTQQDEYDLARRAARQLYTFGRPLPNNARWPQASEGFARAWETACVSRHERAPLALAETLRQSLSAAQ
jgi:hypothetical protein